MKKKKRLNSKIIFTITMVFVLCFFMLTSLWTAKKNDINTTNTRGNTNLAKPESCVYCDSWGYSGQMYITRVMVADLDNESGSDPGGYGDYTGLTAHLIKGKTYCVSLENITGQMKFRKGWRIWIDYNGDCDFEDEGEEVFSAFISFTATGSFSVPEDVPEGTTRMRVSQATTPPPPCDYIGQGEVEDYTVDIGSNKVGNTAEFPFISTSAYRRAIRFTMPENGKIYSISMYHEGGSGSMILALYDGVDGYPQNRLAVASDDVLSTPGWQTIYLENPVWVCGGYPIWLAWVYSNNPGIRYQTGSPGRYQSPETWSGGMPDPFGDDGTQAPYIYSIYASYTNCGGN